MCVSVATLGVDYLITPDILTFYAGQFAFDGVIQCAVVEILDDDVGSAIVETIKYVLFSIHVRHIGRHTYGC